MRFCSNCDGKLLVNSANRNGFCPTCNKQIFGPFICQEYFSPTTEIFKDDEFSKQILNNKNESDSASSFLSKILFEHIQGNSDLQLVDLIIPIPNFKSELQNVAAVSIGLKYSELSKIPCDTNVLIKTKSTKGRKDNQSREARKEMACSSYDVCDDFSIKNKKILLVDDVLVGGSTTQHCAELLIKRGASQVKIICLGRYGW